MTTDIASSGGVTVCARASSKMTVKEKGKKKLRVKRGKERKIRETAKTLQSVS